jgi:hypothetical protein
MDTARKIENKKRLMFIRGEDFNFLTYNILILLDHLNCTTAERPFIDHRKISFLIDFICEPKLTTLLTTPRNMLLNLAPIDKQLLVQAYSNGAIRLALITRLLQALSTRGLIGISSDNSGRFLSIYLNRSAISETFLNNELYLPERQNLKDITVHLSRIRSIQLKAFLERTFEENGISTWHS